MKRLLRYAPIVLLLLLPLTGVASGTVAATSQPTKKALIISPFEWLYPSRLNVIATELQSHGYTVDTVKDDSVTVDFLKTGLAGYNIIIFRTQALNVKGPYVLLTGEHDGTTAKHMDDRNAGRVAVTDGYTEVGYFGITESFISYYYPSGSLNHGVVYMLASESLALDGILQNSGMAAMIGYGGNIDLTWGWGDAISYDLFHALAQGATIDQALNFVRSLMTDPRDPSQSSVPLAFETINYEGDGSFTI